MGVVWLRSDYDTPALRLGDVIAQRLGDRVERQRPAPVIRLVSRGRCQAHAEQGSGCLR
jgi:hypothetical protein